LQEALGRLEKELEPTDELNELIAFCRSAEKGIVR
jgi:hypothetical protein